MNYKETDIIVSNCIITYNSLNYLKLLLKSIEKNHFFKNSPILIYSENSTDDTNRWLNEYIKIHPNVKNYVEFNDEDKVRGIAGGMNFIAEKVETPFFQFLHTDMYVAKNQDLELLKLFDKYPDERLVASSYRVEPNIWNNPFSRPGTVIVDRDEFGEYWNNFQGDKFDSWADEFSNTNKDLEYRKGEGVSIMLKKEDWDSVGGNDLMFSPAFLEDMDLFIRMQLKGYKFIQTINSVVFHFSSRTANFPDDNFNKKSERQLYSERKNTEAFLRKYGKMPEYDDIGFVKPITPVI